MQKIREWGFPVVLIAAWMIAAAYALSLTIEATDHTPPAQVAPPAASALQSPVS